MPKTNDDPLEAHLAAKRNAERLRGEADRLAGARDQALRRLKEECGAETVAAGRKLAKQLEQEAAKAEREFAAALAAFNEKWEGKL